MSAFIEVLEADSLRTCTECSVQTGVLVRTGLANACDETQRFLLPSCDAQALFLVDESGKSTHAPLSPPDLVCPLALEEQELAPGEALTLFTRGWGGESDYFSTWWGPIQAGRHRLRVETVSDIVPAAESEIVMVAQ